MTPRKNDASRDIATALKRVHKYEGDLSFYNNRANLGADPAKPLPCDLSDLQMVGIVLLGRTLPKAKLSGANLRRARLTNTDLTNADLTNTDLTNAQLVRTNLTRVQMMRADLTYADLTRANLTSASLSDTLLTRAWLLHADLTRVDLTNADLTNANLNRTNLSHADLTRVDLTNADLTNANLNRTRLIGATLTRANLTYADLTCAKFTLFPKNLTANFRGSRFFKKAEFYTPEGRRIYGVTVDPETGGLVPTSEKFSEKKAKKRFEIATRNAVYFAEIYGELVAEAQKMGLAVRGGAAPVSGATPRKSAPLAPNEP